MTKRLTSKEVMQALGIRSRMTLRSLKTRGLLTPCPGACGQGKRELYDETSVCRALMKTKQRRGGLGVRKTRSQLGKHSVTCDPVDLLSRVAYTFEHSKETDLRNVIDFIHGTVSEDRTGLSPLKCVPAQYCRWAQCAKHLNPSQSEFLIACFVASQHPEYRLRTSLHYASRGRAWEDLRDKIYWGYVAKELRKGNGFIDFSLLDGTYAGIEQMLLSTYRTTSKNGRRRLIGLGRAGNTARKALENDSFWIENEVILADFQKLLKGVARQQGKFPAYGAVACILGCSRMHAWRLMRSVRTVLRKCGGWDTFNKFFGVYSDNQEPDEASSSELSLSADIEAMFAETSLRHAGSRLGRQKRTSDSDRE